VLLSQDIIRYKSSQPYKWLCYIVGRNPLDRLELLENVCIHRYSLNCYTMSTYRERQEVKAATMEAFQKGQIPFEVMILINGERDYQKASFILSYELKRSEDREALMEQQRHNNMLQEQQQIHANKMEEIAAESKGRVDMEKAAGYFQVVVADKNNKAKSDLSQYKAENKPAEMEKKTEEQTKLEANKASIKSQHAGMAP
jgi:hypothetical protein